eukprot:jgi/Chlat1/6857/Chrsp51S06538
MRSAAAALPRGVASTWMRAAATTPISSALQSDKAPTTTRHIAQPWRVLVANLHAQRRTPLHKARIHTGVSVVAAEGGGKQKQPQSAALQQRGLKQYVKSKDSRSVSSTRWLQRQVNDPFVAEAKRLGYRSRAAFKLLEIDDKFKLFRPGVRVVDLGAAPGSWTQVALKRCGANAAIVGIDLLDINPMSGATFITGDFLAEGVPQQLKSMMQGPADVVLSDMAANSSGDSNTDHLRIMNLVDAALYFAEEVLRPGGSFVTKILQGGLEKEFVSNLRGKFDVVKNVKPKASRKGSSELYIVATGYKAQQ